MDLPANSLKQIIDNLMSNMVLRFFPRQTLLGDPSAASTIYSDIFEVVTFGAERDFVTAFVNIDLEAVGNDSRKLRHGVSLP